MQKTGKKIKLGAYFLEVFPEETKAAYDALSPYAGEDMGVRFFLHLLPKARQESLLFLGDLGIDPAKIFLARPLTEPDEKGEILYLCSAKFCGCVLAGGDTEPRQSEEIAGLSVIFVGDRKAFSPSLPTFPAPETEIRFVISLPFDASFFENKEAI